MFMYSFLSIDPSICLSLCLFPAFGPKVFFHLFTRSWVFVCINRHLPMYHLPMFHLPMYHLPMYHLPMYPLPMYHQPMYHFTMYPLPMYHLPMYHFTMYHLPMYLCINRHLPMSVTYVFFMNVCVFNLGSQFSVHLFTSSL